jgi:hypothetical protein
MDLERLLSERFASNAVVLLLGMLAYNLLRGKFGDVVD